jgi:colanic acid/amylovoran biosynthesis glycosyltransferase
MLEEIVERVKPKLQSVPILRGVSEENLAHGYHEFQLMRLRGECLVRKFLPRGRRVRVAATACWGFPIYSQTFVYQELSQLIGQNFDVRFLYSSLNSRDQLPSQFSSLWPAKRKLVIHPGVYERDYLYFKQRVPDRIDGLVEKLCHASGMAPGELRNHYHFRQAFSFSRMVEAYRPDYLHSYFFYEGTLFTLFASHLLGIPRGVSCYADHVLKDYALKVVPLHMEQCSLVIATSHRIKRELTAIAPHSDPNRILVKPNAINSTRFPEAERKEPEKDQPHRLVCVSRIEPKKGILYLVEALRHLLDRNIDVRVHVLGAVDENAASQDYAAAVETRIKQLGLGTRFHLEGRKTEPEIRKFLEDAHLFVAPFVETESGDKDGIPTALLEAMASGLPAVATDAGSITEVIDHRQDGLITQQRDPIGLAQAIEELLVDPERRRRLGQAAACKIRQRFDVAVCERLFHDRIRTVVADRRRQSGC